MASGRRLTQIHYKTPSNGLEPVTSYAVDTKTLIEEEVRFQELLLQLCPEHLWHNGSYSAGCPRPILLGYHHQKQLHDLHEALTIAIADIVDRWWNDEDALLWERMPLEKDEEDLLRWLNGQVALGNLSRASQRLGSWRPDFLVENNAQQEEIYKITEINARYSFNGFLHESYGQNALNGLVLEKSAPYVGATDPEAILNGLFELFDTNKPLHLLKGSEKAIDINMFPDAMKRRLGMEPRFITPDDLRILPDDKGQSGFRLFCTVSSSDIAIQGANFVTREGEIWEEVYQVGLELRQRELLGMQPEILRQVALRCFNDVRTIMLIHDKRLLGVVKQEIPRLVARKVLTWAQAEVLREGVTDTILPGSVEMKDLLKDCQKSPHLQNSYILKPIRSGKGAGIVFREDLEESQWISALKRLSSPGLPLEEACVVQRRIIPCEYDLLLKASVGMVRYPLVGTYHVVNGRFLGLGIWRASGGRIAAVSSGGSWICSVIKKEEDEIVEAGVHL